jgi:hypothetical protein
VAEKNNPTSAPPPGGRWATQEEVRALLARAKRILRLAHAKATLLAAPAASKWVN